MTMISGRLMLALLLFSSVSIGQSGSNNPAPRFSDFPSERLFTGKPAVPVLTTELQRLFKTQIRLGMAKSANFAGRFRIIDWGCGSDCLNFVIADLKTGKVYDPPFKSLGLLDFSQPEGSRTRKGLDYKPDSRLLVADGCPDEQCGTYYFVWNGEKLKQVDSAPGKDVAQ